MYLTHPGTIAQGIFTGKTILSLVPVSHQDKLSSCKKVIFRCDYKTARSKRL